MLDEHKRGRDLGWATGRHALITGGGSGIGAATARMLAAEGAKVSILGRRIEPLRAIARDVGGTAIVCDITKRDASETAFAEARTANGPIDFLVLNAGIADSAPFARTSRDNFDRIIATNLTALFDASQLALPDLLQGENKRIVVVASVAGLRGAAYAAPYVASKHGAVGLVKSLALEFSRTHLTVNAVCPGFVDTPMTDQSAERIHQATQRSEAEAREVLAAMNPSGRLVSAEEVAASILHLCHPMSRSITGACLTVDGGAAA